MADGEEDRGGGTVFEGKQLSFVGNGATVIPSTLSKEYGAQADGLDLSNNRIRNVSDLDGFVNLRSLVLDNNELQNTQKFPTLKKLTSLCVNNNNITDLKEFLDCVKDKFPALTYLSLLKNPACPNYFVGKEESDYQRYRYYVLWRLPKLKYLDSSPVTEAERKEANRIGQYMVIVKPSEDQYRRKVEPEAEAITEEKGLPPTLAEPGVGSASFGKSRYIYWGKESEGNRFIVNSQL